MKTKKKVITTRGHFTVGMSHVPPEFEEINEVFFDFTEGNFARKARYAKLHPHMCLQYAKVMANVVILVKELVNCQ